MRVKMKPGKWLDGFENVQEVYWDRTSLLWRAIGSERAWHDGGFSRDRILESKYDLVRYLGPLELSPSIACAEAGAAGDPQTVSTRDPQESLRRMRAQHNALAREEAAYGELLAGIRRAKDDLEEAIKMLEKGVEG